MAAPVDPQGEPRRELPGHIAALLDRSARDEHGRPSDSAGIAWEGRDLSGGGNPLHTFDGDDGLTAAPIVDARAELIAGQRSEAQFVEALRGQRLFVPVMATLTEEDGHGSDRQADIVLVTITSATGRQTMPVFTHVTALTSWHPEARPVAAETERVMLAALEEGAELIVLDPGSDLEFVLRRPAMTALAQGRPWTPSYEDPQLAEALGDVVELCPGVTRLIMRAGRGVATTTVHGTTVPGGGTGPELMIGVVLDAEIDDVEARMAVASVRAALEEMELLRRRADSVEIVLAS